MRSVSARKLSGVTKIVSDSWNNAVSWENQNRKKSLNQLIETKFGMYLHPRDANFNHSFLHSCILDDSCQGEPIHWHPDFVFQLHVEALKSETPRPKPSEIRYHSMTDLRRICQCWSWEPQWSRPGELSKLISGMLDVQASKRLELQSRRKVSLFFSPRKAGSENSPPGRWG